MTCKRKQRDGMQSRAPVFAGRKYCAMHADPARAAELGSKGGRRRVVYRPGELREFAAPKTAANLRELLAESIVEIRAGKLDSKNRQCARLSRSELLACA